MRAAPRLALLFVCCFAAGVFSVHGHATVAADQAAAQLEEVMSDPLFSRWQQRESRASPEREDGWASRYAERWAETIGDWLEWLFRDRNPAPSPSGRSLGSGGGGLALGALLKGLGWVLLIVVVGLLLWMLLGWLGTQRSAGHASPPTRAALDSALKQRDALAADADAWATHAQALAEERDLRQAFRAMFLSLLSGLHSSGDIRYRAQRTNWAYVRGFRGPSSRRDAFGELTRRFDDVWYGHREPRPEEFDALRGRVTTLLREAAPDEGGGR